MLSVLPYDFYVRNTYFMKYFYSNSWFNFVGFLKLNPCLYFFYLILYYVHQIHGYFSFQNL